MQLEFNHKMRSAEQPDAYLIKGGDSQHWLLTLRAMNHSLETSTCYPLHFQKSDEIWGLLVVPTQAIDKELLLEKQAVIRIAAQWYVAEDCQPNILPTSPNRISEHPYFFHPETGIVVLEDRLNWDTLFKLPDEESYYVIKPSELAPIPVSIDRIQVEARQQINIDAIIKPNVDEEASLSKRLNALEWLLLKLMRLFSKKDAKENDSNSKTPYAGIIKYLPPKLLDWLSGLLFRFNNYLDSLEERNKREVDKLIDYMKKNPQLALKMALPLERELVGRGTSLEGSYLFKKLGTWLNFDSSGSGYTVNIGDHYFKLLKQYEETASEFIRKKDYKNAAYVYLKLIKDKSRAAETLKKGGYYEEAAQLYLDQDHNLAQAAACYEEGNMPLKAIYYYRELKEYEKAGDLYAKLNQAEEARIMYESAITAAENKHQHTTVVNITTEKLGDVARAEQYLLQKWDTQPNANLLNTYFELKKDATTREQELPEMIQRSTSKTKQTPFLESMKKQLELESMNPELIKETAIEFIAKHKDENRALLDYLKVFLPNNEATRKDILRYSRKSKPD